MNISKTVDFRLMVVYTVAQKLSFTKASQELNISQPAVTKHVREMEYQLQCRLFVRKGNAIARTSQGDIFLSYAEKIIRLSKQMESEIGLVSHSGLGNISIGASTTVAQTIIPRLLALFKKRYPKIELTFVQANTDVVSSYILDQSIDIAIVEGVGHIQQINYSPYVKDEMVLVTRAGGKYAKLAEVSKKQLCQIPLVLREAGSGSLDVIRKALSEIGLTLKDLNVEIQLESSIAIKQYLLYSETAAFLSIQSVVNELKYNELTVLDIKDLEIYRDFQFAHLHGQVSAMGELFMRFCRNQYNL
ncbi:LysR family transcriptional regulator [Dyadobacter luteus]|uniref:LysR family transcriptional regulator n=1 Tax=Dyadobacter luteus TaxID=2259619 RepID=A0A3D8YI15_9BACT|nr:LysR substrate-binding domain-containing protein [Dyadobacter luteus]REA64468.1 LysR family transcriptional regulator [Dyadobacter luteus]